MRHAIPISGKDSLATALVQTASEPDREYEFWFNDTGQELPETYAWLDMVEERLPSKIQRVGEDLAAIIEGFDVLPSHQMRYCTRLAKIQPMERHAGEDKVRVYFGLRADEPARVGYRASKNIEPAYPLRDMNIDLRGVWTILQAQDLLPPSFYWPDIEERVDGLLEPGWRDLLEPWEHASLFAGRSRGNCYFCFYQRQYEYVWLYETHPDLFEKACALEEGHGGGGQDTEKEGAEATELFEVGPAPKTSKYTWREGYFLRDLPVKADEIKDRRARDVAKVIAGKMQGGLFTAEGSLLATTSCGLLCGK